MFPTDQQQMAPSIESASRELISELPSLVKGQAIISGVAINTPALVKIRKRLTSDDKGKSRDAPAMWEAQRRYEEKHEAPQINLIQFIIFRYDLRDNKMTGSFHKIDYLAHTTI